MENEFIITKIEQVILVGKEKYKGRKITFSNEIQYNELIFHFSGESTVYFGSEALRITPNTIRFLPQGTTSRYEVERKEPSECIDVFFKADRAISDKAFAIDASKKEYIGSLFKKLFATWIGKGEGYYFESISLLYKIFAQIQKRSYIPNMHYNKIKPAIEEIDKNLLNKQLSNEALASLCGISSSYLKKLFNEKFGVPPKKYIIQKKINYACELLRLKRYTVSEISAMSNFSDVYFFSRQFKEYMGITPTEFIKKYKS